MAAPSGQYPHDQPGSQNLPHAAPWQQFDNESATKQPYPPVANTGVGTAPMRSPWSPNQAAQYSGVDIANEDVDENIPEDTYNASPPSYDLAIAGYENAGSGSVGPPPPYAATEMVPALVDSSRMPNITEEEAREALLVMVGRNCCWGPGAAREMSIKDIIASNAYHYVLETYTEGRNTCYTNVPYVGGYVDGPHNGPAPMPWDLPCNPTALFATEEHRMPVPHTEVVRPCHLCCGRGFNRCGKCKGRGKVKCSSCNGSGRRYVASHDGRSCHEPCSFCNGWGRKDCRTCRGHGCVVCYVCAGYGSVKQFIQLTVTFTNRKSDHIVDRTDLPNELIRNVQGDTVFEQELPRVCPIQNFFDQEINQKSSEIVGTHASTWPAERILRQRHVLRSVPVHECHFRYKDKPGRFWVYGHQHEVYTIDYPHTCCCCSCTIL